MPSVVKTDNLAEHTTGAGLTLNNTLNGPGYILQPDSLDIDMTIPVGMTLYVRDTMDIDSGKTLTVLGTLIVL